MAKKKSFPKCPACGKAIKNHKKEDSLDCVKELDLEHQSDIFMMGRKYADLNSWGQRKGDRNVMTLRFGKRTVDTIMPEFDILQEVLESVAKTIAKKESKKDAKKDSEDEGS